MPDHIKASIERLFHKIPAMKFSLICMLSFPNIYHFTVNIHYTHYLPGAPLTAGSGAFIFIQQTGFAGIILFLIVFQSTGRRGTFLSEEQIYNLLWHSQPTANCVNRTTLLHVPETNARANL